MTSSRDLHIKSLCNKGLESVCIFIIELTLQTEEFAQHPSLKYFDKLDHDVLLFLRTYYISSIKK